MKRSAFILFEAMLAVTIFVLAVLVLAKCVDQCLRAEMLKDEDSRAMRYLQNRMAEIEAGAVPTNKDLNLELEGTFAGMKLHQERRPLKRKNEKDQEINGLFEINLELTWANRNQKQSRALKFYLYPREG